MKRKQSVEFTGYRQRHRQEGLVQQLWPARGRSAFQLGRDLRHVAAPEPRAGARLSDRRRFLANGRSILYHGEKSDSQRTGLGRRRHGKNGQHGAADSGHSKRQ